MDQATHNTIFSFIWGIADDVLCDLFKRGKYPIVMLSVIVILVSISIHFTTV